MSIDYYAITREIIDAFDHEGLVAEANALREVMGAGATASEILVGVRWQLQQVEGAKTTLNLGTKRKVRALTAELDKVLS